MGTLNSLLRKHTSIALDTCVWIYHFEQNPDYKKAAAVILDTIASGKCTAVMSELVLLELVTGPLKLGRQDVADQYEMLLNYFPNLTLVPVSRAILLEAARIRAGFGFKTPDAIMLATAKAHGATLMLGNDGSWTKYPELAVATLKECS